MTLFSSTPNNDSIVGTISDDLIYGDDGNDTLDGNNGNDYINGGSGNNSVLGGAGNDSINNYTSPGTDVVSGGSGNDTIDYGWGHSGLLSGDGGNDVIKLYNNNNVPGYIDGGDGDDKLESVNSSTSTIIGGSGNDTIRAANFMQGNVQGGDGNDAITVEQSYSEAVTVTGGLGEDVILSAGDYNLLDGGAGHDHITVQGKQSTVQGGAGDDTIVLNVTDAVVATGSGRDTIQLTLRTIDDKKPTIISDFQAGANGDILDLQQVWGRLAELGYAFDHPMLGNWLRLTTDGPTTLLQVDLSGPANGQQWTTLAVLGGAQPSAFTADNFSGHLAPAGRADVVEATTPAAGGTLIGWDGSDRLSGGIGKDLLDGGFGGDDTLSGGEGNDTLFGFSGNDSLLGGSDRDVIVGGAGNDYIAGGSGDDSGDGQFSYMGLQFYSSHGLLGGAGNDTIDGNEGNDALNGGAGSDVLNGGNGADTIDNAPADTGYDTVHGGEDNDQISYSNAAALFGDSGNDQIYYHGMGAASVDGGSGNDRITINNGANSTLLGGTGNDSIGAGDSYSYGGRNAITVDGGDGDDSLDLSDQNWNVTGGTGNDQIRIKGIGHQVDGGTGNDTIRLVDDGRWTLSQASLRGGDGRDVFILSGDYPLFGGAASRIADFAVGANGDRIDLSQVLTRLSSNGMTSGSDPFTSGYLRMSATGNGGTALEMRMDAGHYAPVILLDGVMPSQLSADNFVQAVLPVVSANQATPVLQGDRTVVVMEDSGPSSLGITAPTESSGGALVIRLDRTEISYDTSLTLADGSPVLEGQILTAAQLTGLKFTPRPDAYGSLGYLRYSVTDADNSTVYNRIELVASPVNDAPTVSMPTVFYVDDGVTRINFQPPFSNVSDSDDGVSDLQWRYAAVDGPLPDWLRIDPDTHQISGIAPLGETRSIRLALTVTDPDKLSTTVQFTLQLGGTTIFGGTGADTLTGYSGDDALAGFEDNDVLRGGKGNDSLAGGLGGDTLDGGDGIDQAIYWGNRGEYTVTRSGASYVVYGGVDGGDLLQNIEVLRFADSFQRLTPQARDSDGDGRADLLLRNANGTTTLNHVNGSSVWSSGSLSGIPSQLRVVAYGDGNGDGKSDLLLRDPATGDLWSYWLNGATITSFNRIDTLPAWQVAGYSDFNGDGYADVLLRNSSNGQLYTYLMRNTNVIGQALIDTLPAWSVAGTGDYNGDGKADILLRNSNNGQLYVYLMNGASIASQGLIDTLPAWTVAGNGDYNGDGKADILLNNSTTGQLYVYQMNGATITGQGVLTTLASPWAVADAGSDYNGDGKSDLLLRNASTGQLELDLLNGTAITSKTTLAVPTGPLDNLADAPAGAAASRRVANDFNGDGKSDILLRNPATGQLYEYQMNGATVGAHGTIDTLPAWNVAATGDFNGDGKADLLLRNPANGQLYEYMMDGAAIIRQGVVDTLPAWQVAGTGDFNGDGKSDILLRHGGTGQLYQYMMNGAAIADQGLVDTLPAWSVGGIGDFNGDGKSDILLQNTSNGRLYIYKMSGATIIGQLDIAPMPAPTSWHVAGTGDYNGDGKSDILLRNASTGEIHLKLIGNSGVAGSGVVDTLPTAWQVADGNSDFNGDGKSDILLRNTSTGQLYEYLMSGNVADIGGQGLVDTLPSWSVAQEKKVFSFTSTPAAGSAPSLPGFTSGADKLHLKQTVFSAMSAGQMGAGNFVSGANAVALDANDFIIYNSSTGALYYDADGNGAGAAVLIATLAGQPALAASDIFTV